MEKKIKYIVWIGFRNHIGEINDKTVIAVFYDRNRAYNYVSDCNAKNTDDIAIYGIDEQ